MRLRTCLLAAALIIASGTTGWVYLHSFRSPREALLAAIKGSRPTEARLGGAGFAPYDIGARHWLHSAAARQAAPRTEATARARPARPAPPPPAPPAHCLPPRAARQAARRIEATARSRSSPRARGDLAILWLLSGRSD